MNPDTERVYPLQFFGLLFLLSVPFWLFGNFISAEFLPGLPVSAAMVICPAIAGALLAWRADGTSALWTFFRRAADFVDMRLWVWLVALATMPLVMLGSGMIPIGSGESLPALEVRLGQTVTLFALFFLAATAEELGWTGYVTGPLVRKQGMIVAGLIIGGVAVVWHVIPLLQADRSSLWIAWWAIGTMCRRVLIVWLYVKGGQRVFAASLFHAMNNVSWMLFPVMGSHYDPASTATMLVVPVLLVASISGNTRSIVSPGGAIGAPER